MPRGDGTGPLGIGPVTGTTAARFAGPGTRRHGRQGGYGCRNMYYETGLPGWVRYGENAPPQDESELLSKEAERLEDRLKQVRSRKTALEGKKPEPGEREESPVPEKH